jgi:hypothetical protein
MAFSFTGAREGHDHPLDCRPEASCPGGTFDAAASDAEPGEHEVVFRGSNGVRTKEATLVLTITVLE